VTIVSICFAGSYINNKKPALNGSVAASTADSAIHIAPVQLIKEPPAPPKLPQPKLPQPLPATIKDQVPIIAADDRVIDTMPLNSDLEDRVISDITRQGVPSTSDNHAALPQTIITNDNMDPGPEPPVPGIIEKPEIMPEFPGGTAALLRFLRRNLQVPEDAQAAGLSVKVPVKFVVNRDGNLSDLEFPVRTDDVFKKEILRVIAKMPEWSPGLQHGKTVAVRYMIPIIFDMTEN
jgi:periplasmic protein TonB